MNPTPDPYVATLQDLSRSDAEIRLNAVKRLGTLRDLRAVPVLIQLLEAKEAPVRSQAALALAKLKAPDAIEPLIHILQTDTVGVRKNAAAALGRMSDPRIIPALIQALTHSHAIVTEAVAKSLGKLGDRRAVPGLLALVSNPDRWARGEGGAVQDPYTRARSAAVEALGRIGDPQSIPTLIVLLSDDNRHVRPALVQALAQFGGTVVPALLEGLRSENAPERLTAVMTLQVMGIGDAAPLIIPLLNDPDNSVRKAAISYLRDCGDTRAVPALVATIGETTYMVVDALLSLGESGRDALNAVLDRQSGPILPILYRLQRLDEPDNRFVLPLITLLSNSNADIRAEAALTLGSLHDERAVLPLVAALHDEDGRVRDHAIGALRTLGHARAFEPLN